MPASSVYHWDPEMAWDAESVEIQALADAALREYVAELRHQFQLAERFRGAHARRFWSLASGRAHNALAEIEFGIPEHLVQDAAGLENLRDAIESSLLGVRAYREQFARVQWMVKSPRDLLARLRERRLFPAQFSPPKVYWLSAEDLAAPASSGGLFCWGDAA